MTGAELIVAERQRQILAEGWSPEHDDAHDAGQLVAAAVTYALESTYDGPAVKGKWFKEFWYFEDCWFKPKDKIRDLTRAGALLAAEIDRLKREEDYREKCDKSIKEIREAVKRDKVREAHRILEEAGESHVPTNAK